MLEAEELRGRSEGNQLARMQKPDARAEEHGFVQIVGDEENGFAEAPGKGAEFALEFGARDGIQGAERLIHKQNGWVGGEGAGDTDALALASGKFAGIAG